MTASNITINNNTSDDLEAENKLLREELLALRRQISQMQDNEQQQQQQIHVASSPQSKIRKQQQPNRILKPPSVAISPSSNPAAVELEMPAIIVPPIENIDIESQQCNKDDSHKFAGGLHHRTSITSMHNKSFRKSSDNTAVTLSTISSQKTRKTELLTDDDGSSSSIPCYDQEDDEARCLILGDALNNSSTKIEASRRISAATAVSEGGSVNHQDKTFWQSLTDRAGWLIGLLVFQSLSSFILARNESLLQQHTVIVQFLTMLVGAGGNAGNQASVGVVRGIAVGTVNKATSKSVLKRECMMGLALSLILGLAGFVRAKVFAVPWMETFAITTSLFMIVIISVVVGASLPLGMEALGIDPAHSSTTIQVIMDITGVVITVQVCALMLNSDFAHKLLEEEDL